MNEQIILKLFKYLSEFGFFVISTESTFPLSSRTSYLSYSIVEKDKFTITNNKTTILDESQFLDLFLLKKSFSPYLSLSQINMPKGLLTIKILNQYLQAEKTIQNKKNIIKLFSGFVFESADDSTKIEHNITELFDIIQNPRDIILILQLTSFNPPYFLIDKLLFSKFSNSEIDDFWLTFLQNRKTTINNNINNSNPIDFLLKKYTNQSEKLEKFSFLNQINKKINGIDLSSCFIDFKYNELFIINYKSIHLSIANNKLELNSIKKFIEQYFSIIKDLNKYEVCNLTKTPRKPNTIQISICSSRKIEKEEIQKNLVSALLEFNKNPELILTKSFIDKLFLNTKLLSTCISDSTNQLKTKKI